MPVAQRVRDGVGFSAGLRLTVRVRLPVRVSTEDDGAGEDAQRAVPGGQEVDDGGGLGTVELADVLGVALDDEEVAGVLVVGAALEVLLVGAVVVGDADLVAASGDVTSWCEAIRSFGLPARKLFMKSCHVRPGMSLP